MRKLGWRALHVSQFVKLLRRSAALAVFVVLASAASASAGRLQHAHGIFLELAEGCRQLADSLHHLFGALEFVEPDNDPPGRFDQALENPLRH